MNKNDLGGINRASAAAAGFIIASFVFVALVVIVKCSVKVPAVDADRTATIANELIMVRSNEVASLNNPGWVDKQRGIVRLPIDTALQISLEEWQNPAQARADLLARSKKATAPVQAAPAKPNPYE